MAKKPANNDPTTVRTVVDTGTPGRLYLLVLHEGGFVTQPLPDTGDVIIGRSERCDVRIMDPSISRQHAILRLGDSLTVEDLGSVNGTVVREQPLQPKQPTSITTNEMFRVGEVSVVVQQRQAAPLRARRVWGHDYFEGRVGEECARAERSGAQFTVVRVILDRDVSPPVIREPLADVLREVDVVGIYSPSVYELLLIDAAADEAKIVTERLQQRIAQTGVGVRVGIAVYPANGRDADKLLVAAADAAGNDAAGDTASASDGVVLDDPAMRNLYQLAERVAAGTINVLILGETGVGKQVLAETIHGKSPRASQPFLELNCSAFTETLLESELFGHEKGSFTGATSTKPGLLQAANGGTVFLDEIGDMALSLQAKLLRVIENREVLRVGGLKPQPIDVRFVAATNRDLEQEVMRGAFRQDLYFRINGVTLQVPPLRERVIEIAGLVDLFAKRFMPDAPPRLSSAALSVLQSYSWPGNIRELRNVIERATLLCTAGEIGLEHLPTEKMAATYTAPTRPTRITGRGWPLPSAAEIEAAMAQPLEEPTQPANDPDAKKKQQILAALMQCGGNNTKAAKMLGISRRTLGKWLDKYGIPRPRKGAP